MGNQLMADEFPTCQKIKIIIANSSIGYIDNRNNFIMIHLYDVNQKHHIWVERKDEITNVVQEIPDMCDPARGRTYRAPYNSSLFSCCWFDINLQFLQLGFNVIYFIFIIHVDEGDVILLFSLEANLYALRDLCLPYHPSYVGTSHCTHQQWHEVDFLCDLLRPVLPWDRLRVASLPMIRFRPAILREVLSP